MGSDIYHVPLSMGLMYQFLTNAVYLNISSRLPQTMNLSEVMFDIFRLIETRSEGLTISKKHLYEGPVNIENTTRIRRNTVA